MEVNPLGPDQAYVAPETGVEDRFNEFPKHKGELEDEVLTGMVLIIAFVVPAVLLQPATVAVTV